MSRRGDVGRDDPPRRIPTGCGVFTALAIAAGVLTVITTAAGIVEYLFLRAR
jgi:hypothetical protein